MVVHSAEDSILSPVINDTTVNLAPNQNRAGIVSGLNMCINVGKTFAPAVLGVVLAVSNFDTAFWATGGHRSVCYRSFAARVWILHRDIARQSRNHATVLAHSNCNVMNASGT